MRWTLGLAALVLLAPAAARAACTITANPVAFGVYLLFSATPTDSTGSVQVNCTGSFNSPFTIALNAGLHSGGSFSNRRTISGGSFLSYQLYSDAARTTLWGNGTGGTSTVSFSCGGTCTRTATVFGRILALQAAAPGSYADTITVTVTF